MRTKSIFIIPIVLVIAVFICLLFSKKDESSRVDMAELDKERTRYRVVDKNNKFNLSSVRARMRKNLKQSQDASSWMETHLKYGGSEAERDAILLTGINLLGVHEFAEKIALIEKFSSNLARQQSLIIHIFRNSIVSENDLQIALEAIKEITTEDTRQAAIKGAVQGVCAKTDGLKFSWAMLKKYRDQIGGIAMYEALLDWPRGSNDQTEGVAMKKEMLDDPSFPDQLRSRVLYELSDELGQISVEGGVKYLFENEITDPKAWQSTIANNNKLNYKTAAQFRDQAPEEAWKRVSAGVAKRLATTEGMDRAWKFLDECKPEYRANMTAGLIPIIASSKDDFPLHLREVKSLLRDTEYNLFANSLVSLLRAMDSPQEKVDFVEKSRN